MINSEPFFVLSAQEKQVFEDGYSELATELDPRDFESFLAAARAFLDRCPTRLAKSLLEFRRHGNDSGFLYVTGLPTVPNLPPTPSTGHNSALPSLSSFCATVLAASFGEPVGYLQEGEGRVLHSVFPTCANKSNLSSQSSAVELTWHTELAFHPYTQDWLLLAGLRRDPAASAKTSVLSFRKLIPLLERDVLGELRQQNFSNGIDPSFGAQGPIRGHGPRIAIISDENGDMRVRYDVDLVQPLTPGGARALDRIAQLAPDATSSISIEPGSVLVVDNRCAAHARTPFEARFDGCDRWLIRIGVRRSLDDCRRSLNGSARTINVDFSNYL